MVDRFNQVSARFAEELTDDEMNDVIARAGGIARKRLMLWMPGTLSVKQRLRWMRCVCQMARQMSQNSLVVSADVLRYVGCCIST